MKEKPIPFSSPMVQAILSGAKTQTRRLVKGVDPEDFPIIWGSDERTDGWHVIFGDSPGTEVISRMDARCPYEVGMRLWVRETWRIHKDYDRLSPTLAYKAMGGDTAYCIDYLATPRNEAFLGAGHFWGKKRVSIHMPRWASRINLEVSGIRVEQLQDISEEDAISEGIQEFEGMWREYDKDDSNPGWTRDARHSYKTLWEKINGSKSWDANPWVWVVEFKKLESK